MFAASPIPQDGGPVNRRPKLRSRLMPAPLFATDHDVGDVAAREAVGEICGRQLAPVVSSLLERDEIGEHPHAQLARDPSKGAHAVVGRRAQVILRPVLDTSPCLALLAILTN